MGIFEQASTELDEQRGDPPDGEADTHGAATVELSKRASTVMAGGEEIELEDPETTQTGEGGNWLSGDDSHGRPRGSNAIENRQIVQTSAMQSIVNGITDQLLGGNLAFETDDETMESLSPAQQEQVERLKGIVRSVITGPHYQDESLDDLVTAAVEDMLGPGNAYWQLLKPASGSVGLPVASITTLDPLTIRHNQDETGAFLDPPYWQARSAFAGGSIAGLGSVEPTPLERDQLAVMSYPRGNRSYQFYPISPSWQVRRWLEILANSTTHHNRFYSDNEHASGLLHVINASQNSVDDIRDEIKDASGDPRKLAIAGGEGTANWIDLGGTAINLDIIQEQEWFFKMCLGSLGLGKMEIGLIEDANRTNGEIEATRVYKRVTGPFIDQFEGAFYRIVSQFDAYQALDEPFRVTISHSDPREERAREERLRQMYQAGGLTLRQYVRRRGDEDLAEDDDRFTVEVGDTVVDYGDHPLWVAKRLFSIAGATDPEQGESETGGDAEEQTLDFTPGEATPQHNGGGK